jgi:hypothetical protein
MYGALRIFRRWYWLTALILQIACLALTEPLVGAWLRETFFWHNPMWYLGIGLWAVNLAWTFGVAPYLDSADRDSAVWSGEPRRRLAVLRQIVWAPAGLIVLSIVLLLVAFPLLQQRLQGRWVWGLSPWMVLFIPGLGLSIWYARRMGRLLERRLRLTVRRSRQCFHCGYSLVGIAARRCPECGQATALTRPGRVAQPQVPSCEPFGRVSLEGD